MAPTAATALLRWSDEEHDLLVEMTNDQIQLEEEDEAMVVSWTKHFKQVSARLAEHGYHRTPNACRGYWKREIQSQQTNEQAAGPRWDDSEHQILVGMTEDQLELERADPFAIIPWAQHWKKVSLRLHENGYDRSADACSAYWILAQHNTAHAARSSSVADAESQEEATGGVDDGEHLPAARVGASSLAADLQSARSKLWYRDEHQILLGILKSHGHFAERGPVENISDIQFWTQIAEAHQQYGFDRTWEACKIYWEAFCRSRDGFNSRPGYPSKPGTEGRLSESKLSNLSSLWSTVNEPDDVIVVSDQNAAQIKAPRSSDTGRPRSPVDTWENPTLAPDPNLLHATAINALGYASYREQGNFWNHTSSFDRADIFYRGKSEERNVTASKSANGRFGDGIVTEVEGNTISLQTPPENVSGGRRIE